MSRHLWILFAVIIILSGTLFIFVKNQPDQPAQIVSAFQFEKKLFSQTNLLPVSKFKITEPVQNFKSRITKKSFGIFITPETSPVQPDRFTGYHTGIDAEFTDTQENVPVSAIADGDIIFRGWVPGYGGIVVIRHIINQASIIALYGHLDPMSFLPMNSVEVTAGQQIGILGDDHSEETDYVRKHLHLSFYLDRGEETIDFRGYVQKEEELANWLDPLDFIM